MIKLPILPLLFSIGSTGFAVWLATDSIQWGVAAGIVTINLFLLAEWCVDQIITELRKMALRMR